MQTLLRLLNSLSQLAVGLLGWLFRAYVITVLWGWFLPWTVPSVTLVLGFTLLFTCFYTPSWVYLKRELYDKDWARVLNPIGINFVMWGLGWIVWRCLP